MGERPQGGETGCLHVEIEPLLVFVQIGIETQETRKPHQEDQMEVGKTTRALVQPYDGVMEVGKERIILGLFTHCPIEELRQKEGDG